jgi:EAL domain-containing protein (putative c-di-GMP-specific phosphodiesterase class I)
VLEVTDTDTVPDDPAVEHMLNDLRRRGVRLALDDFGAGVHTLTNLRRLPIDMIKIDRSILAGAAVLFRDDTLLAGYVDLGRRLDIAVVAVGVETDEASRRLVELGCGAAQGNWFSLPLASGDVTQRLTQQAANPPAAAVPGPRPSGLDVIHR